MTSITRHLNSVSAFWQFLGRRGFLALHLTVEVLFSCSIFSRRSFPVPPLGTVIFYSSSRSIESEFVSWRQKQAFLPTYPRGYRFCFYLSLSCSEGKWLCCPSHRGLKLFLHLRGESGNSEQYFLPVNSGQWLPPVGFGTTMGGLVWFPVLCFQSNLWITSDHSWRKKSLWVSAKFPYLWGFHLFKNQWFSIGTIVPLFQVNLARSADVFACHKLGVAIST